MPCGACHGRRQWPHAYALDKAVATTKALIAFQDETWERLAQLETHGGGRLLVLFQATTLPPHTLAH